MFESNQSSRKAIVKKILLHYRPSCNTDDVVEKKPNYLVRSKLNSTSTNNSIKNEEKPKEKTLCPCCGSEMKVDKVLENTKIIKCIECGLSDTRLNS